MCFSTSSPLEDTFAPLRSTVTFYRFGLGHHRKHSQRKKTSSGTRLGIFLSFCLCLPGTGKKEKMRRGTTQSSAKAKSTPMMSIRIFSETLGVQNITKQSWGQKGQAARSSVGASMSEPTSKPVSRDPAELEGPAHQSSSGRPPALFSPSTLAPPIWHRCPQGTPGGTPVAGGWRASEGDQLLSLKA